MARPRGSRNKPKDANAAPKERKSRTKKAETSAEAKSPDAGIGHNSGTLTDEQQHALHVQHVAKYQDALAVKKKADADFKNTCKLAKSELGPNAIAEIKLTIELSTDEGEAAFKERLAWSAKVARWNGMPIGYQEDFFGGTVAVDPYLAGKNDGIKGKTQNNRWDPGSPKGQEYLRGWYEGQHGIGSAGIKEAPGAVANGAGKYGTIHEEPILREETPEAEPQEELSA